jgi:tRNA pseudouridine55 synthase
MAGLLLLHKPVGPTSFSLVRSEIERARLERPERRPRVCHGGVLDPFAEGLLILLAGSATRLFDHLHSVPKTYEATVRWGAETDNGDPLGKVVFSGDTGGLTSGRLDQALATFVGWHEQTPPATSNRRIGGERAYVRAHRGEAVELPPARVYLHEAAWVGHELPESSRLRVVVRGGYYVRALARDLGRMLGCGAHLAALRRLSIGPYEDPGPGGRVKVGGRDLLPWAGQRELSDQEVGDLRQGRGIARGQVVAPDWKAPVGFPDPGAPLRGSHRGRLAFLLREGAAGQLHRLAEFPGGI